MESRPKLKRKGFFSSLLEAKDGQTRCARARHRYRRTEGKLPAASEKFLISTISLTNGACGGFSPFAILSSCQGSKTETHAPIALAEIDLAILSQRFAFAVIDENLRVVAKKGSLLDWLPEAGKSCCQSVILFGMEPNFDALRQGRIGPFRICRTCGSEQTPTRAPFPFRSRMIQRGVNLSFSSTMTAAPSNWSVNSRWSGAS